MSNEFLNPRRPIGRYVIAAAAVFALLVMVGFVAKTAMSSDHGTAHSGSPAVQPPASVPPASPATSGASATAGSGPVQLVRGTTLTNGVYVGYPHSMAGAVSASVEFMTQLGSTLDPDRSAAVMRLVADPSYPTAPDEWAQGTSSARTSLGLSPVGLLPSEAAVMVGPVEYQLRDATADQATVLLLANYTTSLPGAGTKTSIAVFPLRMHWAGGDWKILKPDATDYSSLRATPGTDQATADGWLELTR
jgi:hypothetical protein